MLRKEIDENFQQRNAAQRIRKADGFERENHGFRYTQMYGKALMEMKAGLTFACMNLKNWPECSKDMSSVRRKKPISYPSS